MFDRYTEAARLTIFSAQREAERFGSNHIKPEHLLLGILRDEALSPYLLEPATLNEIRRQIEEKGSQKQERSPAGNPPLSEESKRVLMRAAEEGDLLQDKSIGNEHLLLGVLTQANCFVAELLEENGVTLATVQGRVAALRKDPFLVVSLGPPNFAPDPIWTELGIPEGYAYPQLLFNPPSQTLILQVRGQSSKVFRPTRLYIKHKDASKYELLGQPEEMTSYESPVTSLKQPLLAFSVNSWQERDGDVSGDWEEVQVIDIETRALKYSANKGTLTLPEGFNSWWISDLLGLADDGSQLHVTAGLCHIEGAKQTRIHYVIAVLDLKAQRLDPISVLRGTFF